MQLTGKGVKYCSTSVGGVIAIWVGKCEVLVANIRLGINEVSIMVGNWQEKLRFKKDFLSVKGVSTKQGVYQYLKYI